MIVDDEVIVRQGIIRGIDWKEYGFCFVAEAENGEEAFEKIRKTLPDVLLLDIRMPVMGGLELMQGLRESYPDMGIIILTSYAEFEYIREAMKYGADEYLLKLSSMPKDILCCVENVYEKKRKEKMIRMRIPHYTSGFLKSFSGRECCILAVHIFAAKGRSFDITGQLEAILCENEEKVFQSHIYRIMWTDVDRYLIITEDDPWECAIRFKRVVEEDGTMTCKMGISNCYADFTGLETAVIEAERACEDTFFSGNEISFFQNIKTEQTGWHLEPLKISECLDKDTYNSLWKLICHMLEQIRHIERKQFDEFLVELLFTIADLLKKSGKEIPDNLKSVDHIYQYIQEYDCLAKLKESLKTILIALFEEKTDTYIGTRRIVHRIQTAVEKNYSMDLNLKMFADLMNISYSYLSAVFKSETGYSFKEYLNLVRINKAKDFFALCEQEYSIYEVAEKTGYSNQFYFSKVFKRYTGMMPSEYKSRYAGKKIVMKIEE